MNNIEKQRAILNWYDSNKRVLPWRDNKEPYRVWISEIMLQQTKVTTVIPYYERFLKQLPSIQTLSKADDDLLNKLWEGLGYYSRVRNLKKAAIQIVEKYNGKVPSNYNDLLTLSGIGDYTAGAILSIAFNKQYTAVDGNVLRVFARIEGIKSDIKVPQTKKEIKSIVEAVMPLKRIGDFNQALMEIGATVCLPNGTPKCEVCPLNTCCKAYQNNLIDSIPMKRKAKKVPSYNRTVLVLTCNNKFGIKKRPESGLLANMYEFYNLDKHKSKEEVKLLLPSAREITKLPKSIHKFSHLHWNLHGYEVILDEEIDGFVWITSDEIIKNYSIPTAFKEYKKLLIK